MNDLKPLMERDAIRRLYVYAHSHGMELDRFRELLKARYTQKREEQKRCRHGLVPVPFIVALAEDIKIELGIKTKT